MSKTYYPECLPALLRAGVSEADAYALRRAAMQLHRWYELECGTGNGGVERDEVTGKTYWVNAMTGHRSPTRDIETPALARVAKIMARYPLLAVYHQTDPRGAPLYILRPDDVPEGKEAESYYSRGLAVYK
jgi:hypothetical protein